MPKKVIAGIITHDGKFLIAQRAKKDALCSKWEFPGGKMEDGETEKECLARELFEEFGITADVDEYLCSSYFEHNGAPYEMRAYFVRKFSGDPVLYEHAQIKWVTKDQLYDFEYPDPDLPIIAELLK